MQIVPWAVIDLEFEQERAMWHLVAIGDVALEAGSSGDISGPNGPWRQQDGGAGEPVVPGQGGCQAGCGAQARAQSPQAIPRDPTHAWITRSLENI